MNIDEFVKLSIAQDKRNKFGKNQELPFSPPPAIKPLYLIADPIDVEVRLSDFIVRFFDANSVLDIQDEYNLGADCFVFASTNGDPIFLKAEGVFTCYHGAKESEHEKITNTFEDFLELIK